MTKRRRGNRHTHYQVPSLQSLALRAIRERGSRTYSHSHSALRSSLFSMDSSMSTGVDASTQTNKRARTAAEAGATEAGMGLQVTIPRAVPHCYNNNYTVKLTYADTYLHTFNYTVGNPWQIFRTNSIYDPDFSGTGHQPLFRDMYASQYDYYCVLACDYEVVLFNSSYESITYTAAGTNAQRPGLVLASTLATTNSSDYVGASQYIYPIAEMKNVATYHIVPEDSIVLKGTLTPGDFIVDAKDMDSDGTWTAVGSNPTVPRFFGYGLSAAQSSALSGQNEVPYSSVQAYVKLHYTVQFTQVTQGIRSVPS